MDFYVSIYEGVFLMLIGSALFCSVLSGFFSIKKRRADLLFFFIYFLASAFASLSNLFLPSYIDTQISVMLFYTFDFIFFLWHIEKIPYYSNQRKIILLLRILSPLFCFLVIFLGGSSSLEENYVILIFNILLLIFTFSFFYSILKEEEKTIAINQYEFWFCASFFVFNVSTIAGNIIFLPDGGNNEGLFSVIIYGLTYISWIIKYFMLLKSALCKIKIYM